MKKYLILFGVIALASCKKYLNVNTDPNNATTTKSSYVFTNAEVVSAADKDGRGGTTASAQSLGSTWTGYWAHSTSFTGGGQEKTYVFTNSDFDFFDNWFDNLNDYQYVINHALGDGVGYLKGPAKVMQAFVFQKMVDCYGNIPYSEAFSTASFFPKYDDAKTVYESLINKLTEAVSDINGATWPSNEPADVIFKGNKTNWVRFANTLKLRILMRQAEMSGRSSYITGAYNAISGGFLTDNVYAQPGYIKTAGKMNPFYANYGFDQNDQITGTFSYRKMNAVIVNWLKNSSDIFRLQRLTTPKESIRVSQGTTANPGDYQGVPMGSPTGYLEASCSGIGTELINTPSSLAGGYDALRSSIIMSLAESYFLQAEYLERFGGNSASAASMYTEGVKAAFRLAAATQTGTATATAAASDAAALTYISSVTPVSGIYLNYTAAPAQSDKVKAIWVQKWVSLCNIDGMEAWAEYRRTNTTNASGVVQTTGNVPYSPRSVTVSGAEPVRLYYPIREVSVNGANVPQGINVFTTKIFWDVN